MTGLLAGVRSALSSRRAAGRGRPPVPRGRMVVHIGLEKTGSTSLQQRLAAADQELAQAGFIYPRTGLVSHHHLEVARAFGFSCFGDVPPEEAGAVLEQLRAELAGRRETAILSSEHFSVNDGAAQIAALHRFLAPRGATVVVYLRNQVDYLLALYAEYIKWGGTDDLDAYYAGMSPVLEHAERVARWAGIFGRESMIVRIYEEEGDTVSSFARLLQCQGLVEDRPSRANVSPPQLFLEALRHANRQTPPERRRPLHDRIQIAMKGDFGSARQALWPLPAALLDRLDELEAANARLAAEFLPDRPRLFPLGLRDYAARYEAGRAAPEALAGGSVELLARLIRAFDDREGGLGGDG